MVYYRIIIFIIYICIYFWRMIHGLIRKSVLYSKSQTAVAFKTYICLILLELGYELGPTISCEFLGTGE